MQIHNNTLIAECSAYDFKEMLERKKVKSWLKSVSAFANTDGGSLFYGVNDDGEVVGLENPQADADFISEMIKARLDPVPEVQLIPIEYEGHTLLEVKVKAGTHLHLIITIKMEHVPHMYELAMKAWSAIRNNSFH